MTHDLLLAFAAYAFVSSITPGPNNAMLLASGVQHGFARTVPHLAGVSIGFALMFAALGAGVGQVLLAAPGLALALRAVGSAYLLWMAWRLAGAGVIGGGARPRPPLSFLQAAAFQWANPKAWVMALGGLAAYLPAGWRWTDLVLLSAGFALINAPCVSTWAAAGAVLARWMADPAVARGCNLLAAALLALSVMPGMLDLLRP